MHSSYPKPPRSCHIFFIWFVQRVISHHENEFWWWNVTHSWNISCEWHLCRNKWIAELCSCFTLKPCLGKCCPLGRKAGRMCAVPVYGQGELAKSTICHFYHIPPISVISCHPVSLKTNLGWFFLQKFVPGEVVISHCLWCSAQHSLCFCCQGYKFNDKTFWADLS